MKILFKSRMQGRKSILLNFSLNKWNDELFFYLLPTGFIKESFKKGALLKCFNIKFYWFFWYFEIEYKKYK